MGVFNNFPYTNFHELNQDWIIEQVRNVIDEWNQYKTDMDLWKAGIDEQLEVFQAWFDNLDVQDEVRNVINELIASGDFAEIINPQIATEVSSWLASHITPTTPAIDTSLTVAGAAADAKAVGDKFKTALLTHGYLANGIDFNDTKENGFYGLDNTRTYGNGPRENVSGLLGVYDQTQVVFQIITDTGQGNEFIRWYIKSTGRWSAWKQIGLPTAEIANIMKTMGYAPNNTDLNDLQANGFYGLDNTLTYGNGPRENVSGLLGVYDQTQVVFQIITDTGQGNEFIRWYIKSTGRWSAWKQIGLPTAEIANIMKTMGYAPTNTDLNDLQANGFYGISSDWTYIHAPSEHVQGLLSIYDLNTVVIQTLTDTEQRIEYIRWYLKFRNEWFDWRQVGVSAADLRKGGPVSIIKSNDLFYVRAPFDDEHDVVTNFALPNYHWNYNFNLLTVRMIPRDTPQEDTKTAFTSAPIYKLINDDIPAIDVNGVYLGSNHGNPNYIQCYCTHELTAADIGTVWTDNNDFTYTIVQVFDDYIIVGSLNDDGDLTVRNPQSLRRNGITLTITDSNSFQLRRSAINKKWTITDENEKDIFNGGAGTAVIVTENYDIQNQSKGLQLLQNNVGNNTNDSYFSDDNPYIIAHVENIFRFNRGGSITAYGSVEAKEEFTDTRLYGMVSVSFKETDGATEYAYIPQSSNFATRTQVPTGSNTDILKAGSVTPYRYYQMGGNRGYFMHYINNLGDVIPSERNTLASAGFFSTVANLKLYPIIKRNAALNVGDKLTWGYGKGPMKWTEQQIAQAFFDVGNGWIASADWSNGFTGYMELPDYMAGHEFEVIDKTDSVSVIGNYVTNDGVKVNCTGYGYCVLKIK